MAETQVEKPAVEKPAVEKPAVERDDRFDNIQGKYARIKVRGRVIGGGSIYYRAKIIHVTTNALTVSFFGRPERKKGDSSISGLGGQDGPELMTELVKKIDIVEFQLMES